MAYITQLKNLIQSELVPDVEEQIDMLFESISSNKDASDSDRLQLAELQELRNEYKELLSEISSGEIDEDEAEQLYTELTAMRDFDEDDDYYDDEELDDEDDYDEFDIDDEDENW